MKKIIFKKIKIQNFLSVGNLPIEFNFQDGINLITGENKDTGGKNGIGKSTIADAIYWCLFGNTLRELKKDKIQHNKNTKTCIVELNFSIQTDNNIKNYNIKRHLDPTKIEIFCDGIDITPSTLPKSDELIQQLISATEEVFQNAIIMSANNTLPFMAQKKTDKRKFIEGIFQLNVFSDILLKARSEYNDTKKQHDLLSNDFVNQQKNLEIFEKQKLNSEENKNKKVKEFETKIEENKKTIEDLKNKKIETVPDIKKQIKANNDNIKILEKGLQSLKDDSNKNYKKEIEIKSSITRFTSEKQEILKKGNTCPTCNREFSSKDIETVKNKVEDLNNQIKIKNTDLKNVIVIFEKNKKEIEKIETGIKKIQEKNNSLNENLSDSLVHYQKIETLMEKNKEYQKYIKDIQSEKGDFEKNIQDCKKQIEKIEKNLKEIKKELNILNTVKFVVSEEGIKTFIIKKMIKNLNQRLNFYLKKLDTPCKCEFNEMFEETIYNNIGKECSYFNFSGGERKRIDVAILFMFQDILRLHSNTFFSINIYDELFDSALDEKGVNKILDILKEKVEKYKESVYIISHKNMDKTNIDNVFHLEKENGITKLIS